MAPKLISHQQSAFVPGRNISECITLVSENMHLLNKKIFGGNAAIRLDIAKAFDTLSWDFLLSVLNQFGFNNTFVNWIRILLNSAHLSILVNGTPKGYFTCSRGVRQGDPLSPLLFFFVLQRRFLAVGSLSCKWMANLSLLREAAFQSLMFFLQMMFSFFVEGILTP